MVVLNKWVGLVLLLLQALIVESSVYALNSSGVAPCNDRKLKRARTERNPPDSKGRAEFKLQALPSSIVAHKVLSFLNLHELLEMEKVSTQMKAAARLSAKVAQGIECDGVLPKIDYALRFPQLKSFRIRNARLGQEDLERLAAIKTLTELDLIEITFASEGLDHLPPFSELLIFRVTNWNRGSTVLPNFNSTVVFPKLQEFVIRGLQDRDNFIQLIEDPSVQQSLQVAFVSLRSFDVPRSSKYLSQLQNLRVLKLNSGSDGRPKQLPTLGLGKLSQLSHLEVGGLVFTQEDLVQLSRLENLVELGVMTSDAKDLVAVGEFKKLVALNWDSLERGELPAGLPLDRQFPSLKILNVSRAQMNSFDLKLPSSLEDLRFTSARPELMSGLGVLPALKTLHVKCTVPGHHLPSSLHQIVPNLAVLGMSSCAIQNFPSRGLGGLVELRLSTETPRDDLQGIGSLQNLETLYVDSRVRSLLPRISLGQSFPKLRDLTLSQVSMEFSDLIASVEGVKNSLERLEIRHSELSGKVDLSFGQLTRLRDLDLCGTDASMEPDSKTVLEQLKGWKGMTQLRRVHLGSIDPGTPDPKAFLNQMGLGVEYFYWNK